VTIHPPRPGDRFRVAGYEDAFRFVGVVLSTDGAGWIVRTEDGKRWRLSSPDETFDAARFVGEPIPDEHPPTPRLMR
jgi:hypothetical protein